MPAMAQLCTRSIGLQVSLCQCTLVLPGGNTSAGNNKSDDFIFPTPSDKHKDKDDPEMASNVNEDEAVETDHLLAGDTPTRTEDAAPIDSTTETANANLHSTAPKQHPPAQVPHSSSGETTPKNKEHSHHHFQFKRKFNFRSDSVFSDVLPSSSSQDGQKPPGDSEKSGSLSSLKPKESKWVTLKRKLGKLNSSPASSTACKDKDQKEKSKSTTLENKAGGKGSNIHEKRSLLQRAKTLSILPTNRMKEQREDLPPKRHVRRMPEHPELFNVGGEIDMIPLELLIDINDLKK